LRKVLPDLQAVEHSGNSDKPLMVQVVRFSNGIEQLDAPISVEPREMLDMGRLIALDEAEHAPRKRGQSMEEPEADD
jgi:hypothetical protein